MHSHTLLLFIAPFAFAATTPRTRNIITTGGQTLLTNVLATCPSGYSTCEDGCMRSGNVCCEDGTGESCQPGNYCVPNGCCPVGEICTGGAGDAVCDVEQLPCGEDHCMPDTATCCGTEGYYCPNFGVCLSDGSCCDLGDDCDGSSGSSDTTSTFELPTTATTTKTTQQPTTTTTAATITSDDGDDSFTTPTPTFESSDDNDDDGSFTSPTPTSENNSSGGSSNDSSNGSSNDSSNDSSNGSSNDSSGNTQPSTTPRPGQAGGHYTADGWIAAGFAVVAAFLV